MKLPSKEGAFLAPMARITDVAFRSLCVKYGASMTVTELVSAKGLLQTQNKSKMLTIRAPNEKEFAVQLFGKEPETMADAASLVSPDTKYIDINLGCPVPKVVRHGMGSALLAKPEQIAKIISKMSKYVKLKELKIKTESKRKVRAKIYLIKKQDNKLIYYETFKNNTTIQLPDTNYEIELSKKISFFKRKKEKIIIELNKNKEIFI